MSMFVPAMNVPMSIAKRKAVKARNAKKLVPVRNAKS